MLIDRKQTGAFDKINTWIADEDDAAMPSFRKDRLKSYQALVEATFKELPTKLGVTPTKSTPELSDWWKFLRPHLTDQSVDKPLG
ncbi:hypothetical protein [Paenarthrobacter sp. NPDC089316]|uniref:hypothetical protein n=1 Tax=unclassified Paenarthrobacter TaxID=2634190 RepID=UPI00343F54A5